MFYVFVTGLPGCRFERRPDRSFFRDAVQGSVYFKDISLSFPMHFFAGGRHCKMLKLVSA